jgi:hypothetical protein
VRKEKKAKVKNNKMVKILNTLKLGYYGNEYDEG